MEVSGKCHCGRITYKAVVDPSTARVCHCSDCQSQSGTAYRANVTANASDFFLIDGKPTLYMRTADSGKKRVQAFCPTCGSPLYAHAQIDPQTYTLRINSLDQRAELAPVKQVWCKSSVVWSQDLQAVPKLDRQLQVVESVLAKHQIFLRLAF